MTRITRAWLLLSCASRWRPAQAALVSAPTRHVNNSPSMKQSATPPPLLPLPPLPRLRRRP